MTPSASINRRVVQEEYVDEFAQSAGVIVGDGDNEALRQLITKLRDEVNPQTKFEIAKRIAEKYRGSPIMEFALEDVAANEVNVELRAALLALIA